MKCHKIKYAAALLSVASINANATLSSVDNGLGVYDSALNVTWTSDANLLGTLESQQGYDTVINAIIASSPVIHDKPNGYDTGGSGIYNVSTSDFSSGGFVSWFGAEAFVNYLNNIEYGNSNQWALPTTTPDNHLSVGYNRTSSQLGELYYNELNALAYPDSNGFNFGILGDGSIGTSGNAGPFTNVQTSVYWSDTEYSYHTGLAWDFGTLNGLQGTSIKTYQNYAWAVTPEQMNAIPVPGAVWLFGTGMVGLLSLQRRGHAGGLTALGRLTLLEGSNGPIAP